ncbi:MAG: ATP-binding protein, partial [Holosporales bacterium]
IILIIACISAGVSTYMVFSRAGMLGVESSRAVYVLNIDLILLLLLAVLVARRLVRLWAERRQGRAGAQLHARIVLVLSVLTATPTVILTVFFSFFFHTSVMTWFNDRVQTALNESTQVAEAYLQEHIKGIRTNVQAMANDLARELPLFMHNPELFSRALDVQAEMRGLNEAIVFNSNSTVLARSHLTFALEFERLSETEMQRADRGIVIKTSERRDRVRALTRVSPHMDLYLFVGRLVDSQTLRRVENVNQAVDQYRELADMQRSLEIKFYLIFMVIVLLLVLISIWLGLIFANGLVRPISDLVWAAERVRSGDLSAQVREGKGDDELTRLLRAFNRMVRQLNQQKLALVAVNHQLDVRRQFIEDVIAGISAGVIYISPQGEIRLINRSARELLSLTQKQCLDKVLRDVEPRLADCVETLMHNQDKTSANEGELVLRKDSGSRTLLVRVVSGSYVEDEAGHIITVDDITQLLSAQRKAAWADVARSIAHEIKNPLTPIQLSAERLRRRYLKQISEDPESFNTCVDTIIRQVHQIGRMVSEFSSFARMPAPQMADENLVELIEQALFLQQSAHPQVTFKVSLPENPVILNCDASQMGQVLTNLLQNALDALKTRQERDANAPASLLHLELLSSESEIELIIEDNGDGFPEDRERLLQPYVTLREKGTGLGLAIVKKIVEDHGGMLYLEDRQGSGARVRVAFEHKLSVANKVQ